MDSSTTPKAAISFYMNSGWCCLFHQAPRYFFRQDSSPMKTFPSPHTSQEERSQRFHHQLCSNGLIRDSALFLIFRHKLVGKKVIENGRFKRLDFHIISTIFPAYSTENQKPIIRFSNLEFACSPTYSLHISVIEYL